MAHGRTVKKQELGSKVVKFTRVLRQAKKWLNIGLERTAKKVIEKEKY